LVVVRAGPGRRAFAERRDSGVVAKPDFGLAKRIRSTNRVDAGQSFQRLERTVRVSPRQEIGGQSVAQAGGRVGFGQDGQSCGAKQSSSRVLPLPLKRRAPENRTNSRQILAKSKVESGKFKVSGKSTQQRAGRCLDHRRVKVT
jgi:hypothetical protein